MMLAPSWARRRACERPCPRATPVMNATLPSSRPIAVPFVGDDPGRGQLLQPRRGVAPFLLEARPGVPAQERGRVPQLLGLAADLARPAYVRHRSGLTGLPLPA